MMNPSQRRALVLVLTAGNLASFILAATYFWFQRFRMSGDGVSYLEVGEWILGFRREGPLNTVWSPLYGVIIAGLVHLFGVTGPNQVLVVQFANLLIYCAALASCTWMIWHAVSYADDRSPLSLSNMVGFTAGSLIIFNYCALALIGSVTSADMLLLAVTCLTAVLILKLETSQRSTHALILGVILGVGYLAKSVFFPVSLLLILVMSIYSWRSALYALAGFCVVSLPFVGLLSMTTGRVTIGDNARMVYALGNGVPSRYWMGGENGTPIHPPRVLHNNPDVFEFGGPPFTQFTFPPHYNPAYWQEGLLWTFDLKARLSVMRYHLDVLRGTVVNRWSVLAVVSIAAVWLLRRRRNAVQSPQKNPRFIKALIAACLGAIGAYTFIGIEPRYLAPFIAILVPAVWLCVQQQRSPVLLLFGLLSLPLVIPVVDQLSVASSADDSVFADTLIASGLQPGSRLAAIGGTANIGVWARLSGLRISVHIPNSREFWSSPTDVQRAIFERLRSEGVAAVIAIADFPALDNSWRVVSGHERRAIQILR